MSFLHDFLIEERTLVCMMPVRIALWMSHCDDVAETERDSSREMLAAEKACQKVVRKSHYAAFTNDVFEAALANREEWLRWKDEGEDALFTDIKNALYLVDDRLPADAAKAYRKALYYIAVVVAQAAKEQGADDFSDELPGGQLVAWLIDKFTVGDDMKTPENVSEKEKAALAKLKSALKSNKV